ncbi:MAG: hypothetical protein Aurels2KO_07210 [Aureliella sp.]
MASNNCSPSWLADAGPICKFAACVAVIVVLWCCVFPMMSQVGPIEKHIETMEANGIDVSAMFYTELDALDPTIRRLENR